MFLKRYGVYSALLHLALLLGFVFLNLKRVSVTAEVPVEVKLISAGKPKGPRSAASSGLRGGVSARKLNSMLFPSFKDGLLNKVVANSQEGNPPDVPEFARGYQGMDMSKIRFIKSLWHEIDQSIVESKYLSEYGHVGQVRLTFEVGPDGHLVENYFRAQASDPILKVVAARAVRKALKNENENLVLPKETTKVVAQFNWAGYATCERRKGTEQNFLSFCKYGENKIKNFTSGERTETYLKAIATHGPWAIEEIQNYRREEDHRKTQFDPFEEMRRDPDYDLGS